jgi:hypothetical protein
VDADAAGRRDIADTLRNALRRALERSPSTLKDLDGGQRSSGMWRRSRQIRCRSQRWRCIRRSRTGGSLLRQYDHQLWIVDAKWWSRLPKADQDAIEQAAAEIQPLTPEFLAKTDNAALAKAKAAGAEVIIITDRAPWQRLMAPIWDQNSTKIPGGKNLITAISAP